MSYSSGPFGPGGYSAPGGPPPMTGGPWGPAPGAFPPPPPPKKSNTGLIVGIIVGVLAFLGLAVVGIGVFAARTLSRNVDPPPIPAPIEPFPGPNPQSPPQTASPLNAPAIPPAGFRAVRGIGYSYAVPAGWEELNAAQLGSPLISHAQRAIIPTANFATNVNIAGEAFADDGPAYGAANLIELRKVAAIRDQRAVTSGSRAAWDIEASWPNAGGVPYVTLQRYVTNGFKGFVLTCSSGTVAFPSQRPTCEAVLASLRVD